MEVREGRRGKKGRGKERGAEGRKGATGRGQQRKGGKGEGRERQRGGKGESGKEEKCRGQKEAMEHLQVGGVLSVSSPCHHPAP